MESGDTIVDGDFEWVYEDDHRGVGVLVAIGFSARGRMLAVVHTVVNDRDRIISAREVTPSEAARYR